MISDLFLLFLIMIIQVIIPPIPAELIILNSALSNNLFLVTLFGGLGLFIGSVIVFYFGNYLSSFFPNKKVNILKKKFDDFGFWILLIRILPYNPSDIISYVAGILKYDKKKYLQITFFVTFTRVFILAFIGSRISSYFELIYIFSILFISGFIISYFLYKK